MKKYGCRQRNSRLGVERDHHNDNTPPHREGRFSCHDQCRPLNPNSSSSSSRLWWGSSGIPDTLETTTGALRHFILGVVAKKKRVLTMINKELVRVAIAGFFLTSSVLTLTVMAGSGGKGEAQERWTAAAETHPLTGVITGITLSPMVPMKSYGEVKSQIAIRCDRGKTRIRIRFNQEPNFVGGEASQRYAGMVYFYYRSGWNGDVKTVLLYHAPGEWFVQCDSPPGILEAGNLTAGLRRRLGGILSKKDFLRRLSKHQEFRLETRWSGLGETYFVFPLAGAREAIRKCREIGKGKVIR